MKFHLLLLTLLPGLLTYAQPDTTIKIFPSNNAPTAFIKGHRYEIKVNKNVFKNDFELSLSDSSYEIASFVISWDNATEGVIREKINNGPLVKVEGFTSSLAELADGSLITFDHIRIKKKNDAWKISSFYIRVVDRSELEYYLKTLARCDLSLGPYRNNSVIHSPVFFNSDLELTTTDPGYSVVSFELSVYDISEHDESTTLIASKTIRLDKDDVTRRLKHLTPGSSITLEHIKLYKDGRLYEASPFFLYIK